MEIENAEGPGLAFKQWRSGVLVTSS